MRTTLDLPLATIAERYFEAWGDRDPDRIAELHTDGTVFELHTGGEPVEGREAVRDAFAAIFETWLDFRFETNRVLLGEGHWVLDWTLIARPASGGGEIRLGCLDLVTVSPTGLVSRKDTYVDAGDLAAVAS